MRNYGNEIVRIAEDILHEFVRFRINEMDIQDKWKSKLPNFIKENYPNYRARYQQIHDFLKDHDIAELSIDQLDITSLSALSLYFFTNTFFGTNIWNISNKKDIYGNIQKGINDIYWLRNGIYHRTQEIPEKDIDRFIIDQLYYLGCLSNFVLLIMRERPDHPYWKRKYQEIKRLEQTLQDGKTLKIESVEGFVEDVNELLVLAKQNNTTAQLKLGIAYYYGTNGAEKNIEKAFEWLVKAAEKDEPEAEYLISQLYKDNDIKDSLNKRLEWLLRSAKHGFAKAQYEYGFIQMLNDAAGEYSLKEFLKDHNLMNEFRLTKPFLLDSYNKQYWMEKAAEQGYPNAYYELSGIFDIRAKLLNLSDESESQRMKELSQKYEEKAVKLGSCNAIYYQACDEEDNGNYEKANELFELAKQHGWGSVEREIKRIKNKMKN